MLCRLRKPSVWCRAAVAAACALVPALPLAAQAPPAQRVLRVVRAADSQGAVAQVEAVPQPDQAAPPAAAVEPGQPVETQVKLAWLSDPLTFPYPLGATLTPQGLAVTGYVPNEAVRARVVAVAQEHAGAAVVDRLQLYPNLYLRLSRPAAAADLRARA